ncbi:hypothetical protein GNZ01_06520 [Escherichia coli]|uniref:Uncharacterized protein n=6 Tax=root TaxID=1 RepID=A0AAJ3CWU9_ECOLX|nr:hypothetical protein [Escherichia coli]YP_009150343.1 hypothetical protein ACQ29_gp029 [Escherichia phage PBECO4]AXC36828.1 hypothetical protein [Escherichia phage UB]MED6536435.1 hypothetical protein [Escherichia coli O157]QBO61868.1 hypothetical protein G17_00379 [Escherichia phage vB_EcoM_G17]WIL00794.1 hypothetical protein [Escherichia phage vB_EcoM_CRJP21]WNN14696.1 hypothetical protein Sharanji_gp415 [Escherichia phage Sharanji]WPK18211.1 hypothetical protein [Salmonella phage SD-2_
MLSFREQLAKGQFQAKAQTNIPKKSAFLGTITEDGFCDYDAPEDSWYITKDTKRSNRLHKSTIARKHRKELKKIRFGEEE